MQMKFLVVDGSSEACEQAREGLRGGFGAEAEVVTVSSPKAATERLQEGAFDCLLLDTDSSDLMSSLRSDDDQLPCAIVVMTGTGSEEATFNSLKLGAHDYINKDGFDSSTLKKAVTSALHAFSVQQQLQARQLELARINDELRRKDRLKMHFVASASHELRTPVSAMLGLLELLEHTSLSEQQFHILENLKACGDSLLLTVDDIIDLAKIEAGHLEIRPYPFHLPDEIQDSLLPLNVLARDKSLQLSSHLDEDLQPWRLGDRRRIRQILNNLVGNAIKYTYTGRVDVSVEATTGNQVRFSVIDTGPGISSEDQARIWEPYFQGAVEGRPGTGSGLGLTTCLNLVKAIGGHIDLDSTLGQGSTFSFEIPLPVVEAPKSEPTPAVDPSAVTFRYNILLVEDNRMIARVLQTQLKRLNHNVFHAPDGCQALEILKAEPIDVVFMDCQMPVLDGYETTQKLRHELKLEIPVIALTADLFTGLRERCLAAGMDDYLIKPVSGLELQEYLANLNRAQPPTPSQIVNKM